MALSSVPIVITRVVGAGDGDGHVLRGRAAVVIGDLDRVGLDNLLARRQVLQGGVGHREVPGNRAAAGGAGAATGVASTAAVGGAALAPDVEKFLADAHFPYAIGYGLTETSPIVALNRMRKFRDDAAGLPLPNLEIRIADPDDEGRGEIVVRGPSVMLGYYKNEEATRQFLRDGWFYTGDYGFLDSDGFLHVSGRKKNVIVASNGRNVFPEELEDQVNAIPFVLESVVYGARGPTGDEEICVMVVPNAETIYQHAEKSGTEITREWIEDVINKEIRDLNRRLPLYKQLRRVRIKEGEFEKTTTQKIKRYLIHQEDTTH